VNTIPDNADSRYPDAMAFAHALVNLGVPVFAARLARDGTPDRLDRRWRGWERRKADTKAHAAIDGWRSGEALCAVTGVVFDVIDYDVQNDPSGTALKQLSEDLGDDGPQEYARIRTPSGGWHIWIAAQGIGTRPGFRPGLDLKGGEQDGTSRGFVFLPPTVRPSKVDGRRRRYCVAESELAAPDGDGPGPALVAIVTAPRADSIARGTGRPDPSGLRAAALKAEAGEQRGALLRYVHELERKGYAPDDIVSLLVGLGLHNFDRRRPWTERAFRALLHRPGVVVPDARPGELDGLPKRGKLAERAPGSRSPGSLLSSMRSGDWLDAQKFRPITYAIPQLIPEGLVVLAGPPKIGKSLIIHRFALECARGGSVFGLDVEPRPSLYLALEDGDLRIQTRSRQLLQDKSIPRGFHYILKVEPGQLIQTVRAFLDVHPTGLVVVDTIGKVLDKPQKGETTYDRDYRLTGALKAEADAHPGSTILANHHSRKSGAEDFVDMVSGTQGIAGAADTVVILSRKRGAVEGQIQITGRDVEEAEYALVLERPTGWRLDGEDLMDAAGTVHMRKSRLGERSLDVIAFVSEHPEGVNPAQVAAETGIPPAQVKVYLANTTEAGHIARISRGVYGPATKLGAR
jgi:hypothetical protein